MQFKDPINLNNYYNPWIKPGVVVAKPKQQKEDKRELLDNLIKRRNR